MESYYHPSASLPIDIPAMSLPTPNSCLVAILLIAQSSSGPTLAFHYPPRPKPDSPTSRRLLLSTTSLDGGYESSSSTTSSSASDDDDIAQGPLGDTESRRSRRGAQVVPEREEEEKKDAAAGRMPWERLLGFKTDFLAGALAPKFVGGVGKGKFEMSVDDLVFLGAPVHVRPDGTWRKRKKRRPRERFLGDGSEEEEGMGGAYGDGDGLEEGEDGLEEDALDPEKVVDGEGGGSEGQENEEAQEADDEREEGEEGRRKGDAMGMFHVVFVLNPPELEYHFRTRELFDYVVKRFSRALKYEQAKDGYVWREVEKIVRLKEQAAQKNMPFQDLWRQIMEASSLAFSISRIYSDISQSKISHVLLNNALMLSLQIPVVTEIAVLPSITDPQVPGLPLTTANSFGDDDAEGDTLLAKHFTLLYLDDVSSILEALSAESTPTTASLATFVKACRPTLSFLTISNQTGLPLHEIQVLARHLVHWRKARAIPPIHQRDIYVVSPNADMKHLGALSERYTRLFPSLPALPKILALLSGKPKPYATFIPSRDHRPAYLEILAWLLRHGLVTQLRTFCWIKVPRNIKLAVLDEGRAGGRGELVLGLDGEGIPGEEEVQESFILEPAQASGIESAWLEMMTRGQPPDVKALFERFLKYLNGAHALEKIVVREGVSRKEVRRVLGALKDYLVYAKHW